MLWKFAHPSQQRVKGGFFWRRAVVVFEGFLETCPGFFFVTEDGIRPCHRVMDFASMNLARRHLFEKVCCFLLITTGRQR